MHRIVRHATVPSSISSDVFGNCGRKNHYIRTRAATQGRVTRRVATQVTCATFLMEGVTEYGAVLDNIGSAAARTVVAGGNHYESSSPACLCVYVSSTYSRFFTLTSAARNRTDPQGPRRVQYLKLFPKINVLQSRAKCNTESYFP